MTFTMSVPHVELEVVGIPAPQGSKTAVMIGGKARLIEGKGTAGRTAHADWRTAVASVARMAAERSPHVMPLDGPLRLEVVFRFPMPASRPKNVRESGRAWKTTKPDTDKLLRTIGDALTNGGLIADDARLVSVHGIKVEVTDWTGAVIRITQEGAA